MLVKNTKKITCSEMCYQEYINIHKDEINKKTFKKFNKNKFE